MKCLKHGFGQGLKMSVIVCSRGGEVFGMIEREFTGGEIRGVMTPAGLRARRVDAAATVFEKRTGDVGGGVFADAHGDYFGGMSSEAVYEFDDAFGGGVFPDIFCYVQYLMGPCVNSQPAAQGTAFMAGQVFFGSSLFRNLREGIQGLVPCQRKGCGRISTSDVLGKVGWEKPRAHGGNLFEVK